MTSTGIIYELKIDRGKTDSSPESKGSTSLTLSPPKQICRSRTAAISIKRNREKEEERNKIR
jgi:hypothetical protein